MKAEGAEKRAISSSVEELLALKARYQEITGKAWEPAPASESRLYLYLYLWFCLCLYVCVCVCACVCARGRCGGCSGPGRMRGAVEDSCTRTYTCISQILHAHLAHMRVILYLSDAGA